jgi:RNA polymerase sigma factor (sigma-70 family)
VSPRIPIRLLAVQSDERLVRLVREGHERAFDALVHRYRRPLLRYCRRIGLGDSRAEDVLQLVLLNAWLALVGGTEVRELGPWLYRIAHNSAINALRGPFERNAELSDGVHVTAERLAEDCFDGRIAVCDALSDVAALPAMQRDAILLTALGGKTHDEVAGMLGVNQDAVRGLLYRARTTLRSAAAIIAQPLIGWASGGAGTAAPPADRVSEFSAGGALGLTGALLKGAAVAITAGMLVGGASVVPLHGRGSRGANSRALAGASDPLAGQRTRIAPDTALVSAAPSSPGNASARPLSGEVRQRASAPSRGTLQAPAAGRIRPESEEGPGIADTGGHRGVRGGEDGQAAGTGAGEAGGLVDTGSSDGQLTRSSAASTDGGGEGSDGGSSDTAGSSAGAGQTAPSGDPAEAQYGTR